MKRALLTLTLLFAAAAPIFAQRPLTESEMIDSMYRDLLKMQAHTGELVKQSQRPLTESEREQLRLVAQGRAQQPPSVWAGDPTQHD